MIASRPKIHFIHGYQTQGKYLIFYMSVTYYIHVCFNEYNFVRCSLQNQEIKLYKEAAYN